MSRILASGIALAIALGPLAEQTPAFAARFVAPTSVPGKTPYLPVRAGSLLKQTAALRNFQDIDAFSLDTTLPDASVINRDTVIPAGEMIGAIRAETVAVPATASGKTSESAVAEDGSPPAGGVTPVQKTIENIQKTAGALDTKQRSRMGDNELRHQGSKLFDAFRGASGAAEISAVDDPANDETAANGGRHGPGRRTRLMRLLTTPVGALFSAKTWSVKRRAPPAPGPRTPFDSDEYGGPQALDLRAAEKTGRLAGPRRRVATLKNHILFGAKWAINMMGIATLVGFAVKPLAALFPWQLHVSDAFLNLTGRVELLTGIGHQGVIEAVSTSPLAFLFKDMPYMAGMEEITYRLLGFGLTFLAIAALKPAAARLKSFLKDMPDLFGIPSAGMRLAGGIGGVSSLAFPAALILSSFSFAAAHIAAWGFSPVTFALHLALGMTLAYTAYRTRGIAAPFFAHVLFNLATITFGVLVPLTLLPATASVAMTLAGVFSVAFLWYNYRLHRKAKAEALGHPKLAARKGLRRRILTGLLIVPLIAGSIALVSPANTRRISTLNSTPLVETTVVMEDIPAGPFMLEDLQKLLNVHTPKAGAPEGAAAVQEQRELSAVEITQKAKPAIVMVRTDHGLGTGFIIREDGLLVTNAHVVANGVDNTAKGPKISHEHAAQVVIRFSSGREVPGIIVGYNPDKDIALISLPPNPFGWPTVALGDSSGLEEGERIVAMGHPRGLPFSVSEGIVSGLDFRHNGFVGFVQHDASVNPGNSGGPLFNSRGEVVGINSLIMSSGDGFDGISYAISSADLRRALTQFAKVNNIDTGWMGVIFHPSSPEAPRYGVYVDAVRPDSPASRAGLRAGDVLLKVNGQELSDSPEHAAAEVSKILRGSIPSDGISVTVSRGGAVQDLAVTLGSR